MAAVPQANAPAIFDLRSAALTLIAFVLKTTDLTELARELDTRAAGLFDHDLVAIDLSAVRESEAPIDFPAMVALLKQFNMLPVAVRGGSAVQMAAAFAAGLTEAPEGTPVASTRGGSGNGPVLANEPPVLQEPIQINPPAPSARIIDKPLRSGQQVYAKGGDLIVLASVNFGAEIIADGNIHVYAPLRGRAIAGARGNTDARIFSLNLEPQLVAIAGIYRTAENPLPPEVVGKPAQIRLDGEKLVIEALES